jgi:hypothetical protein
LVTPVVLHGRRKPTKAIYDFCRVEPNARPAIPSVVGHLVWAL